MIIDAENLILGRIATYAAKQALLGEDIHILNCEKAVITGGKKEILSRYQGIRDRGDTFKGPFFQRMPDRFVRRAIRGMLPYKNERGRVAYKKIHCHLGVPDDISKDKIETLDNAHVAKTKSLKYLQIGDLCLKLGGKNG